MKKTLFTMDEWKAGFGHQHAFRVYAGSIDGPIVANCNVVGGVSTGLEAGANTALIADSPDMYDTLASLVTYVLPDLEGKYAEGSLEYLLIENAKTVFAEIEAKVTVEVGAE